MGSLLVGHLAEFYGYVTPEGGEEGEGGGGGLEGLGEEVRRGNGDALGDAFLTVCCIFWGGQLLVYMGLYGGYPGRVREVQRVLRKERKRKEREGEDGEELLEGEGEGEGEGGLKLLEE